MLERLFQLLTELFQSFLSVLKIIIRSSFFLKKLPSQVSNRILILGNGPSLKTALAEHLDLIKEQETVAVNAFSATPFFEQVRPKYYVFVSTEIWKPDKIKHLQDWRDHIVDELIRKTQWPIILLLPSAARKAKAFQQRIGSNPHIQVQYFNTTPVEGFRPISHFLIRMNLGMPRPHNVLIPSIINMITIGYKHIYLLGADHSWLPMISVDEENNALINQQHFYDDQDKTSHMYMKSRPRRLHEILKKFMLSFQAYFDILEYAQSQEVTVYNSTPGSFIDAFPRKSIEEMAKGSD